MQWFIEIDWKLGPLTDSQFQPWKILILSKGQFSVVDREDWLWLSQWKWSAQWNKNTKSFYAKRTDHSGPKQKAVKLHRLIMNTQPGEVVDHLDHNTLENRKQNLENKSSRMNTQKQKRKPETSCPHFVGVSWDNTHKKWRAQIHHNGKLKHLGYFTSAISAALAYNAFILLYSLPGKINCIPQVFPVPLKEQEALLAA